ncbi:duodenase-1-like [Eleutherodactylus coqui]|uniref:duodenase-1-like n=1 Tax=Eleutherodactylus coqui TaxID=57060 RepID=UPI0034621ADE
MHLPVMKPLYSLFLFAACLLTSEGASMKIINGHEARANSRPYMALIIVKNSTHQMICGGSLIKSNWVVTAAHCEVWSPSGYKIKVILGAHSSNENENENGRQIFNVTQYIKHPEYNNITLDNDIQLMKLPRDAQIGEKVGLLSLPKKYGDVKANTTCETAGWGWTGNNEPAGVLMEAKVQTINRTQCSERIDMKKKVERKMCTTIGSEGQNACVGDSGGPLICDGVFRGIVSYGSDPCNKANGVTVYTRLTKEYVQWINTTTRS